MKTHKVGQDIYFTDKDFNTITPNYTKRTFWLLAAITISFFISQGLLVLSGR